MNRSERGSRSMLHFNLSDVDLEVATLPAQGQLLVGRSVKFTKDQKKRLNKSLFRGTIVGFNASTGLHAVQHPNSIVSELCLANEEVWYAITAASATKRLRAQRAVREDATTSGGPQQIGREREAGTEPGGDRSARGAAIAPGRSSRGKTPQRRDNAQEQEQKFEAAAGAGPVGVRSSSRKRSAASLSLTDHSAGGDSGQRQATRQRTAGAYSASRLAGESASAAARSHAPSSGSKAITLNQPLKRLRPPQQDSKAAQAPASAAPPATSDAGLRCR